MKDRIYDALKTCTWTYRQTHINSQTQGRLSIESDADRSMSGAHMRVFLIASHRSGKNSPSCSRPVQNGKNRPSPKTLLLGCSSIYRGLWPLVNQCTPEPPAAMISRVVLGRQACLWLCAQYHLHLPSGSGSDGAGGDGVVRQDADARPIPGRWEDRRSGGCCSRTWWAVPRSSPVVSKTAFQRYPRKLALWHLWTLECIASWFYVAKSTTLIILRDKMGYPWHNSVHRDCSMIKKVKNDPLFSKTYTLEYFQFWSTLRIL